MIMTTIKITDQWTNRQMDGPKDGHSFLCRRTDEWMYLRMDTTSFAQFHLKVSSFKLAHIYNADFS